MNETINLNTVEDNCSLSRFIVQLIIELEYSVKLYITAVNELNSDVEFNCYPKSPEVNLIIEIEKVVTRKL
jgi:hypothetical protein